MSTVSFFCRASIASCTAFFAAATSVSLAFSFASTASAFVIAVSSAFTESSVYSVLSIAFALFTVLPSSVLEASVALSDVTVTVISFSAVFPFSSATTFTFAVPAALTVSTSPSRAAFVVPASASV